MIRDYGDRDGDKDKKIKRKTNIRESAAVCGNNPLQNTPVYSMVKLLPQDRVGELCAAADMQKLSAVFCDKELMDTFDAYLQNGMNISETARILYMHRNTLMYRLKKLRSLTGMDIRRFDVAVTLCVLRLIYEGELR